EAPRGWYTGRCSANTMRLVAETGAFDWASDAYDDDLPHWVEFPSGPQLVIPYTLEANDMRFAVSPGWIEGEQFFTYLRDSFDVLYAEGLAGAPKMMSVGLHNRLVGRPGKIAGLMRFIDHIQHQEGVWTPRRIDIARHWRAVHPFVPRKRPSAMSRDEFVATFGGVYEHSPWIAERAHARELGPAHDSAAGMASALARVFRTASDSERLGVLKAHPDLAGKLAAAKRLTAESSAEQSSAGLDALTDGEREAFARLNDSYIQKHGFPFIIAVRDHDKVGILRAFERRHENDTETEFVEACKQVERIARLRLEELL
ncbi:MAG TPA: 2-oxo-4-hydroxy-4-carboxy-5-ureidoimidazoline decarboxylase, partial [Aliiroseovarius sp.]|nr:2-oxo-4-hydroxy-4-carboxy-5-ureidoimidazoline decarboxylase [Aliiroseovarius sp.]